LRTIGGGGGVGRGAGRAGAGAARDGGDGARGGGEASAAARLPAGSRAAQLGDQRLRLLDMIGGIERERAHQRRRRQQRADMHQQRQEERQPDDADGDDIMPVDRLVTPLVHW
jgi:hypothetical protein